MNLGSSFEQTIIGPKLHTQFQGHMPFGSREEEFLKFFLPLACDLGAINAPLPMGAQHKILL